MKRSKFSLTNYKLLTCQMGVLVPVNWIEVLPGDTIQQSTSALVRCAPLVTPVMHPCHVRFHHFYIPNRIMWNQGGTDNTGWEAFITGGPTGNDNQSPPYIQLGAAPAVSSLADYLGITPNLNAAYFNLPISALPFRAYAMIWNEWFRDQDLQTPLVVSTAGGLDTTTNLLLQNCDWEKDYYTSARPWVLKGTAPTLPLGTSAPVLTSVSDLVSGTAPAMRVQRTDTGGAPSANTLLLADTSKNVASTNAAPGTEGVGLYPSNLFANLAGATGIDINTVRHAFAIQRYQEARARYGSRYVEYLRYLGIRSSDARLQRPEYLGGGRQTLSFSEVLQTAPTTSGTANTGLGTMGGHGVTALRTNRYRRFFEEHGIVMTVMSVRPRTMYNDAMYRGLFRGITSGGLPFMTGTKEDYWQKELESIGQQTVGGLEVDSSQTGGSSFFGYQDRYDDYRRRESTTAGQFRNSTLNQWHLARSFGSTPALNASFVNCVPTTRCFQVTSGDNLYVMCHNSIQARRMLKKTGTSSVF